MNNKNNYQNDIYLIFIEIIDNLKQFKNNVII